MKALKACNEFYCCECPYNYLDNKEYSLRCIHTLIKDVYKLLKNDLRDEDKQMNTAEMWLKAQEDGKIYECINGDMAYSKQFGLTDKYDFNDAWVLKHFTVKRNEVLIFCLENVNGKR